MPRVREDTQRSLKVVFLWSHLGRVVLSLIQAVPDTTTQPTNSYNPYHILKRACRGEPGGELSPVEYVIISPPRWAPRRGIPLKVVILAGGLGSRISEESHLRPKPMIEIGGKPILWHIMKGFSHFGFNDFVICAGYKQDVIKTYFNDYFLHNSDVTFDYRGGHKNVEVHSTVAEPWCVTVADTGYDTQTAGRIKRIQKYVGDEPFLLTYGDGVSTVNPNDIIATHGRLGGVVTITGVILSQRFGVLDIDSDGKISSFREKRDADNALINGGFMVVEPEVFDYIGINGENENGDAEDFSSVTLERLANDGKLTVHSHTGFWRCMDTQRDKQQLENLWDSGEAPWKVW